MNTFSIPNNVKLLFFNIYNFYCVNINHKEYPSIRAFMAGREGIMINKKFLKIYKRLNYKVGLCRS